MLAVHNIIFIFYGVPTSRISRITSKHVLRYIHYACTTIRITAGKVSGDCCGSKSKLYANIINYISGLYRL